MMRWLSFFICLLFFAPAFGQNANNTLDVITNVTPAFSVNSLATYESGQTINNCLTLRVKTRNSNCSLFAKYNLNTWPSGFNTSSPSPLKITFASTSSTYYYNLQTAPITLSANNQLLFNSNTNNSTLDYLYNLTLGPFDYGFIPGSYTFTVTFTMTQP